MGRGKEISRGFREDVVDGEEESVGAGFDDIFAVVWSMG